MHVRFSRCYEAFSFPLPPLRTALHTPATISSAPQCFLRRCLDLVPHQRGTVPDLRRHDFIVQWRPAIFDVDFEAGGRDYSRSSRSDLSERSRSVCFSSYGSECFEASAATRELVAAAACSDLVKTIEAISAYEEDDFIYNRSAPCPLGIGFSTLGRGGRSTSPGGGGGMDGWMDGVSLRGSVPRCGSACLRSLPARLDETPRSGSRLGQIEADSPPPPPPQRQPIAESSEGNAREGDQKSSSLSEAW